MAIRTKSIVFVDAGVEAPLQLAAGIAFNAEVLILSPAKDGVEQIAAVVEARSDVSEVCIVAHGSSGELILGNARLNLETLPLYRSVLHQWASQGRLVDLRLYGCNVAAGDAGAEFLAALRSLTGANIAASSRRVGHASKGGSWTLDAAVGQPRNTALLTAEAIAAYPGVLAGSNNFVDAPELVLVDGRVVDTDDTTGADSEAGEPFHDSSISDLSPEFQASLNDSIWWRWTAPVSGLINATTAGSGINAVVAVYTGTAISNLSSVTNQVSPGGSSGSYTFTASAGTTYFFAVDGVREAQGPIQLTLNVPPVITPGQTFQIGEDATDGALVGTPIAVSKPVTWSIVSGNPDNDGDGTVAFAIDAAGQLSVQDAGDLDFEVFDSFYSLGVKADDGSFSDTESVFVDVLDAQDTPVLIGLSSPASVDEGALITLSGLFSDPDAEDTQIITVDWGDMTNQTVISSDGLAIDASGNTSFALNHLYRDNGDFNISVSISDGVNTVADTRAITVNNVAPTIINGDTLTLDIVEDAEVAFQLKATDPSTLDVLTYTVVSAPASGTLTPNPPAAPANARDRNRLFTYDPSDNFSGTDSFQIQVQDDDGGVDTVTVNVNVEAQPDAPEGLTLVPTPAAINEGEILTLSGNFADPDADDTFTVTIDWGDGSEPAVLTNENLTFNAVSGRYSFAVDHQYFDDTATGILVTVVDGSGAVANGTTGITINNIAPTIIPGPDGSLSVDEDGTATITFTASDPADTNFTWQIIDNGTDGAGGDELGVATLSENSTGAEQTVTYTAAPNQNGLDKFTIQVSDGVDVSTSTIVVGVNPVNDEPTNLTTTLTPTGAIVEGSTITLDGSFFDADNSADPLLDDVHTVTIDWGDGSAVTTLDDAALIDATTPTVSFAGVTHTYVDGPGTFTVTVTATDAAGASVSTTQEVTVENVAPVILDPDPDPDGKTAITLPEDSSTTLTLTATDVGIQDVLTWSVIGPPSNGAVSLAPGATPGEQTFTYTPNLDYDGDDTFTVQVDDGNAGTDTLQVLVTVTPENDPPQIITNQFNVTEGQALPIDIGVLDAIDIDTLDDSQITFTITGLSAGDAFTVGGVEQNTFTRADILNGVVAFQDNGDEVTPAFTIEVSDGTATVSAPANVTLTTVNDAPEIIIADPFTVAEGGRVPVRAQNISATDEESNDADLIFTVFDLVAGQFLVAGVPGNTFTLQQINQGTVQFEHDGSETPPTFTLTVSDGELESQVSYVPGFSAVNDAPTFLANTIAISEGGEIPITTAELNATDIETLPNDLVFSISNLAAGEFLRNGAAIDVTTETFTLEEVLLGAIAFRHDGSEIPPSYSVTVTDNGVPVQAASQDVTVVFTPVNDAPVIADPVSDPPFTLNEDGTVLITRSIIDATDVDNPQTDLTFTVSNVTDGFFALTTDKTVPITSFEWEQVDSRQIVFVHDGVGTTPSYTVTVTDIAGGSDTKDFVVGFNEVNDAPTFPTNTLTISEGERVFLTTANLLATDEESSDAELTYTIDSLVAGTFEVNGAPIAIGDSFTQQQVVDGAVSFVQDGTEVPPAYSLVLTDGGIDDGAGGIKDIIALPPSEAIIGFTAINDIPVLTTDFPMISEGETLPISAAVLSATDEETPDTALVYTVTTTVGSFQLDGADTNTFTQADITAGLVDYVHDGSEAGPTITISVNDGTPEGTAEAVLTPTFVNLNDAPVLVANKLTIDEGATVQLTTEILSAEDLETATPDLAFSLTDIDNGFFTVAGAGIFGEGQPDTTGSFLLRDVIEGRVSFTHDGSNFAPTYTVQVFDNDAVDQKSAGPAPAEIVFNAINDNPELDPAIVSPVFTINEGGTVVLTTASINATDELGETPQEALQFGVTNVENGFFAFASATTVPISAFSWQDVNQGRVVFTHQGSAAPSYTLIVGDEQGGTDTENYTAALIEVNDPPTFPTNVLTISEGERVVLTTANLFATDQESPDSELTYTIDSLTGGTFELNGTAIAIGDSFTQQQVIEGAISFLQDGSNTAPAYSLVLSDGGIDDGGGGTKDIIALPPSPAVITFTAVNDAPILTAALATVSEGETIPITTAVLTATDEESPDSTLVYTVSATVGSFQLDGAPVNTFTQADIEAGLVDYVHDGSEVGPVIEIAVSDGSPEGVATTTLTPTFVNFNDAPTFVANTLTIEEGQTLELSTANLSASDLETIAPNLRFEVSTIENGVFTVEGTGIFGEGQPDTTGSFLLQDVIEGRVTFTHDGSNFAPTYTAEAFDDDAADPKSTGPAVAEVFFTPTNDAPQLDPAIVSPAFEINEESVQLLTTANINATDEEGETPQGALLFTVSNVVGGFFANSTATTVPVDSFTWDEVNRGQVVFSHTDSNTAPSYTLTVQDEQGATDVENYTATLLAVNDAPQFIANDLALTEGDTIVLNSNNLFSSDEETGPAGLTYTINSLVNGQFFLGADELIVGGTFTQQNVLDGQVSFVHNNTNDAPSYELTLTDEPIGADPAISIGPSTVRILDFFIVNDPPSFVVNFPTVEEGAVIAIDNTIISASDDESAAANLGFVVTTIANGEFRLDGAITGFFTQEDINNSRVSFAHNGSKNPPSITLTLSDNGVPAPESVTQVIEPEFVTINTAPTFTANSFSPIEGDFTVLAPTDLAATDIEDEASLLQFTVDLATLEGGQFFLNGVELSTLPEGDRAFTRADLTFSRVVFKDDGDEVPPVISFTVTDTEGGSTTAPATVNLIPVNDPPAVTVNTFEIGETGLLVLNDGDTVNLQAEDAETLDPAGLTYTISELVAGTFFFDDNPEAPINQFTQLDLNNERVVFVQDGSNVPPSFNITVTDPEGGLVTVPANVTFTATNDAPIAVDDFGNGFGIDEDTFLTTPVLTLNDIDEEGDLLTIIALNGAPVGVGDAITLASGATVTLNADNSVGYNPSRALEFLSPGEQQAEPFTYTISDGNGGESTATVTVIVDGVNDAPVAVEDLAATNEATPIVLNVLENDTDFDLNETLSITEVGVAGLRGQVFINGDGTLTYDPTPIGGALRGDETINETFAYAITDTRGAVATGSVTVAVTGVDDGPTAVDDSGEGFATDEDTAFVTGNVLVNDINPEVEGLAIADIDTSQTAGSVISNGDGTFTYDPAGAFDGLPEGGLATDSFVYTVVDNAGNSSAATVTISITGLVETPDSFFDFEQFLRSQDPATMSPAEEVGGLLLAQFFDENFYLSQNRDVAVSVETGRTPFGYQHFLSFGLAEGRDPSILYNEEFYVGSNPDVAGAIAAGTFSSGLQHFLLVGNREQRDPSNFFSQADYLNNNPDVADAINAGAVSSPFEHYVEFGVDEGRGPVLNLYSESFYLATNPDVAGGVAAGSFADGFEHFVRSGQIENRPPSSLYNEGSYLALNPDVSDAVAAGAFTSGFQHYEMMGRFEGRGVFA
ncbi:cadherin-like domain-containing protein [Oscillatoria sp. CS-180]|uniref:cadherin-like domain-containing protein n=1 Tax=Oscillatoria sp. CS-180 TaxID=3021720 RepID=UPI002330012A|nr:cadherin-like domain-containing protein [Oscillatoria sp. CS-180]MDB9528277.1 cadherin-like domain-containing protein [Oscillatoria sp. CS-180]